MQKNEWYCYKSRMWPSIRRNFNISLLIISVSITPTESSHQQEVNTLTRVQNNEQYDRKSRIQPSVGTNFDSNSLFIQGSNYNHKYLPSIESKCPEMGSKRMIIISRNQEPC